MKSELGVVIKKLRKEKQMSQDDLAEKLDVAPANISRYETGKQWPEAAKLENLADALGIKISELFSLVENNFEEGPEIKGKVPLISWVQAGNWQEVFENQNLDNIEWIETTYRARKFTFALRVIGDSMEPKFPEGCIIIVEPEESPCNKSYVIVRQDHNKATFKQLIDDGADKYLKPLNDRYPIMQLHNDAIFCGVVKRLEMDV